MNTSQDQTTAGGGSQPSSGGTQQSGESPSGGDTQHLKDEAGRLADEAKQQGRAQADHYREVAADKVDRVADSIKAAASELGQDDMGQLSQQITRLAEGMTKLSHGLREKSGDEILRDVGNLSRKNPALFVVGGLAIGFGLTRLMKATASDRSNGSSSGDSPSWSQSRDSGRTTAADDSRSFGSTTTQGAAGYGDTSTLSGASSGPSSGSTGSGGVGLAGASGSAQTGSTGTLGSALSGHSAGSTERADSGLGGNDSPSGWGKTDDSTNTDESNGRKPL